MSKLLFVFLFGLRLIFMEGMQGIEGNQAVLCLLSSTLALNGGVKAALFCKSFYSRQSIRDSRRRKNEYPPPIRSVTLMSTSRFSLSVTTRRWYGWLRMVFPGARLFRAPIWCPSRGWRHTRGRDHCRGEPGSALSGGYAPDSAKVEGSLIVDEPGEG